MRTTLVLFAASFLAPRVAAGEVWEVGGGGLATIGEALALAADGDVVLVHAGTYPGFTADGKSLVITAEAGDEVVLSGPAVVTGLGADQAVTLQGMRLLSVAATANAGSLWIEDCEVRGIQAIEATSCAALVVRRSSVDGFGFAAPGARAVIVRDSVASFFSCALLGGDGEWVFEDCSGEDGEEAGDALYVENSTVLLQASSVKGGTGGIGSSCAFGGPSHCGNGGKGGTGLVSGPGAEIVLVETVLLAGPGGAAGDIYCSSGPSGSPLELLGGPAPTELQEPSRTLLTPSPVREGEIVPVVATGEPGMPLAVYASTAPGSMELASLYGLLLVAPPPVLVAALAPADGTLVHEATVPELGVSFEGLVLYLQTVGLSSMGGFVLGEPASVVLLDAAF